MATMSDLVGHAWEGRLPFGFSAWSIFILLAIVFYFAKAIRSYVLLRHFDGPLIAKFSRLWMIRSALSGTQNTRLYECAKKYGSICRIGPKTLLVSDADFLWKVNSVRGQYIRSVAYTAFSLERGKNNILSTRDEKRHQDLRAQMAAGYSGKENLHLESSIDHHVRKLLGLIEHKYLSSTSEGYRPIDFARTSSYFTFDVITDIAFGRPAAYLDADEDKYDFISNVASLFPVMCVTAVVPSLVQLTEIGWINKLLAPSKSDRMGIGRIMGIARATVDERFTPGHPDRGDMLAAFIRHGLDKDQAECEVMLQILAGADTTATALRAILLFIISKPSVVRKILAEFETHGVGCPEKVSDKETEIVSVEQIQQLSYLDACIKEGLRLRPPATGYLQKEVPPGGDTLPDGRFIPGGTGIAYCAWGVMRSPEAFGPNAEIFHPERWLESSPEQLRLMKRHWELGFSTGKWRCLGKDVALLELQKVLVELLRRYDIAVVDPTRPMKSRNYSLFLDTEFRLVITSKNPN
ncbi:hypothetical protein N7523_000100 [Penicillium sp. IBT 18751x]|nr:hypothetical protein N7523_000100 [Penicillium sp. IBT 18751x]